MVGAARVEVKSARATKVEKGAARAENGGSMPKSWAVPPSIDLNERCYNSCCACERVASGDIPVIG